MRHMAEWLRRQRSAWLRATVPWTLEGPGFRWNPRSSKPVGCAQRARWVRLPCSSAKKRRPRPRSARPLRRPQTILRTVRVRPQPCTPVYLLMIARSPRCSHGISSLSWPRSIPLTNAPLKWLQVPELTVSSDERRIVDGHQASLTNSTFLPSNGMVKGPIPLRLGESRSRRAGHQRVHLWVGSALAPLR
jgi:hypothetical protein